MIKILLIGSKGQFGIAFRELLTNRIKTLPIQIFAPERKELDICNEQACNSFISNLNPDWVVNAAAFTDVDKAEEFPDLANLINGIAPIYLANALSKNGGKLIQLSTDFVFDGKKSTPYNTFDKRNPINIYGKTKAKGEKAVEEILHPKGQGTIVRTSWLMSPVRKNFLLTILKLIKDQKKIKVVSDQIGCPTSTFTLSEVVLKIITDNTFNSNKLEPYFHCCDEGQTNWYEIAVKISLLAKQMGLFETNSEIIPIKSSEYITIAKRPIYSLLNNIIIKEKLNYKTHKWEFKIKEILNHLLNKKNS